MCVVSIVDAVSDWIHFNKKNVGFLLFLVFTIVLFCPIRIDCGLDYVWQYGFDDECIITLENVWRSGTAHTSKKKKKKYPKKYFYWVIIILSLPFRLRLIFLVIERFKQNFLFVLCTPKAILMLISLLKRWTTGRRFKFHVWYYFQGLEFCFFLYAVCL